MRDLLALIVHHGYIFIFLIVLAEALGIPVPAALALLTGGAAVASGVLRGPAVLLIAVTAMLLGDSLLYVLGSRMGWRLLGFLCRLLSMFAATVATILVPTAFEARFDLSRIICRKKPKNFLGTKTSTCTALDHVKPRAPVWRMYCGNRDLAHL